MYQVLLIKLKQSLLRTDYHNAQLDSIELNKSILKAIETMTKSIKDLKEEK